MKDNNTNLVTTIQLYALFMLALTISAVLSKYIYIYYILYIYIYIYVCVRVCVWADIFPCSEYRKLKQAEQMRTEKITIEIDQSNQNKY